MLKRPRKQYPGKRKARPRRSCQSCGVPFYSRAKTFAVRSKPAYCLMCGAELCTHCWRDHQGVR